MSSIEFDRRGSTVMGKPVAFRRLGAPLGAFVYEGRVDGEGLTFWTEDGRWRADGRAHPLDLAIAREGVPA